MRTTHRGFVLGVVAALVLCAAGSASADSSVAAGAPSYTDGMLRKLGRGIANIATGPLELIRTPELVIRQDGYLAGMTVGIVHGLWNGVIRIVAGAYETLTFLAEAPEDFAPVVRPEFVWEDGRWAE